MTPRRARERLLAWRCGSGHLTLLEEGTCAACGGTLQTTPVHAAARLVATTTVRVNPTGHPFVLGIAVTTAGRVRTLCVVDGPVRHSGHDRVWLTREGGRIVARAVNPRSRG
jgi:hypothetical protein